MKKSYAVFGLGRYGTAIARELAAAGADVLAVDRNEAVVNAVAADVPFCKCADVTDPDAIKGLGIGEIDTVIISMSTCLEASVLAVMLCKEVGVKTVIVKCADVMQCRILERVGADRVLVPETEAGTRFAKNLLSEGLMDVLDLSDDILIAELDIRPEWVGKPLTELSLRSRYHINVIAVRGKDGVVTLTVDPTVPLTTDIKLVVITDRVTLTKLK